MGEGDYMRRRELSTILKEFERDMRNIFKDDFRMVRLYGSYARGDYNQNSDIDVMVLVNTPVDKINSFYDQVSDCTFEYLMKYRVDISPVIKNMDNEKRQALSVYRMEQAEETLTAAKMCLEYHLYKDCINRSYYVAFYAVKAVLAIEGVDFKRHKDAVAYFNKTYVASGKVSREVGKRLGRIKTVREDSDYSEFYIASAEDAAKQYESACFILEEIKKYLPTMI